MINISEPLFLFWSKPAGAQSGHNTSMTAEAQRSKRAYIEDKKDRNKKKKGVQQNEKNSDYYGE